MQQNKGLKILSLFDGMGCAYLALKRAGISVSKYYASEIDKYAKSVAKYNIPEYIDLGDITKIDFSKLKDIDFIIGGFPCQSYSISGNRKGLNDDRGCLIYQVFRALKEAKPKMVLLENVKGLLSIKKGETFKYILKELNNCGYAIDWKLINSSLVSAQNRNRVYIIGKRLDINTKIIKFNSGVELPKDKGILLKDILEKNVSEKYYISDKLLKTFSKHNWLGLGAKTGLYMIQTARGVNKGGIKAENGKTPSMTTSSWEGNNHLYNNGKIRKLTPIECERLQTVPFNFSKEPNISDTQRYRMLGNSFTVDIISWILSFLNK